MKRTQPHSGGPKSGPLRVRHTRSRRGALLLVVLSILVLFALIGITYVVTAGAYKKGAEAYKRRDPNHDDPQKEIDDVFMQVLRGPAPGTISALQDHDLLGDMYGNESVRDQISLDPIIPANARDLIKLKFNYDPADPHNFVPVSGYYGGCVMTFLSGNAKGHSVRIIRYEIDGPNQQAVFTVDHTSAGSLRPNRNDHVVVNGRPFSGTGFGLDVAGTKNYSTGATLDHLYTTVTGRSYPSALLPNHSLYDSFGVNAGGTDEPYDAADYQNMAMSAYAVPTPTNSKQILPSFHRQDLIGYWAKKLDPAGDGSGIGINSNNPIATNLRRLISLRPEQDAHPNFTGSNPGFEFFIRSGNYVWDVDNDLDNVPDSIWIDPGLPVKTDKYGRRYKALAAILVKGMDGKLNVNAHGSYAAFMALNATPGSLSATPISANSNRMLDPAVPSNLISKLVPTGSVVANKIGIGYGPADVNLQKLFGPNNLDYLRILDARYTDNRSNAPNAPNVPGIYNNNDPLSKLMSYGVPGGYTIGGFGGYYGSHPQASGFYNTVSDRLGRPVHYASVNVTNAFLPANIFKFTSTIDDPYELNLVGRDASDSPFAAEELESMLRYNDIDVDVISSRLLTTAKNTFSNKDNRNLFTTHSNHVSSLPVPPIPRDVRDYIGSPAAGTPPSLQSNQLDRAVEVNKVPPTIIDLARERIRQEYSAGPLTERIAGDIITTIMPWEILQGEPMDLNRPFDSPHGARANVYNYSGNHTFNINNRANYDGLSPQYVNDFDKIAMPFLDGNRNKRLARALSSTAQRIESTFAKQLYARHLFCLMMLLRDADYEIPVFASSTETYNSADLKEVTIRRLAQWAINVVDYRDNDGIMTPFEYDMNPFNGWSVDGDPAGNENDNGTYNERRLVWGTETTDLLLTETLAFHDRKVKDTNFDDSASPKFVDSPGMNPDNDLDQYRVPQGSLFLELYTARNYEDNNTQAPSELYNDFGRLHLGRLTSQNNSNAAAYPVWRMVVTKHRTADKLREQAGKRVNSIHFQPNDTDSALGRDPAGFNPTDANSPSDPDLEIDRMVYFTNLPLPYNTDVNKDLSKFEELSFKFREGAQLLEPNAFTVIGPRQKTYVGTRKSSGDPDYYNSKEGSQCFNLTSGLFRFEGPDASPNPSRIKLTQGVICTMPAPYTTVPNRGTLAQSNWAFDPDEDFQPANGPDVGMNISEPLAHSSPLISEYYNGANYYDEPGYRNGYYSDANPDDKANPATVFVPDDPFDSRGSRPLSSGFESDVTSETKSNLQYKSVLLQRLADPTRDYHAAANPYITVDWKPVDLHVFNGEDNHKYSTVGHDKFDDDDNGADPNRAKAIKITTTQAGLDGGSPDKHLFGMFAEGLEDEAKRISELQLTDQTNYPGDTTRDETKYLHAVSMAVDYFARPLRQTLGYMNKAHGEVLSNELYTGADTNPATGTVVADFKGTPKDGPFGWVSHPNRPLISKYELLNVPASAPQRLLYENTMFNNDANVEQYGNDNGAAVENYTGRFGGLFNFFHSGKLTAPSSANLRRAHYYRILDYVTVPSKFVGSQKHYRSDAFTGTDYQGADDVRARFRYPFSKRSEFRDPGVINLNTMASDRVFKAIYEPSYWTTGVKHAYFEHVKKSVLGHSSGNYSDAARDYPSWFANPFRPSGVAEMSPVNATKVSGVNSTPLRSGELFDGTSLADAIPAANIAANEGAGDDESLFRFDTSSNAAANQYRSTDKNPMYRYQGIQRLGNLTGYQSNVYAVWVTIGYFEVKQVGVSRAIPDGWQLGAELGLDTGDINRHRGFYIMDRSIPVGYEPGEDHNTDDAILVRRFIE